MSQGDRLALILSAIGVIGIPSLVLMIRVAVKWTRVEATLEDLVGDVTKLVEDKDRIHSGIFEQMKADRDATNQRLRWLEENVWKENAAASARPPGPRRPR